MAGVINRFRLRDFWRGPRHQINVENRNYVVVVVMVVVAGCHRADENVLL